jgi:hypothetical protein
LRTDQRPVGRMEFASFAMLVTPGHCSGPRAYATRLAEVADRFPASFTLAIDAFSRRSILRHGPLDVRLAGDSGTDQPSGSRPARRRDGLARGEYDDVGLTKDGVADDCCVRQYFQNKILVIFLSPIGIDTCDQDSRAYRHRCINEFCKTPYIVYGHTRKVRANDRSKIVIPPPLRKRERTGT